MNFKIARFSDCISLWIIRLFKLSLVSFDETINCSLGIGRSFEPSGLSDVGFGSEIGRNVGSGKVDAGDNRLLLRVVGKPGNKGFILLVSELDSSEPGLFFP
ncbi:hypothetical protein WICPIJ_005678 [Wickerhamomyces pijperi]|uniref:Uncharacterized protein n=1 Tax=Wickerhamomyces pijperi TaxID=599730 RepID=A0A9P8Q583_WICPI|nr:hypothetical protein WICPIJ_005678 [Wickerhamomyces pijperi]